ncbi:MAG: hypothetical protein H7A51_01010 [Akkermansiaceae bacterium]|nr:hypothetical protein [Akkermansiaceae bacterium]
MAAIEHTHFKPPTPTTTLKHSVHTLAYLTKATALGFAAAWLVAITPSCSKSQQETRKETQQKAEDKIIAKEEEKAKAAFQTLDILPQGSILRSVRFPRYDKDFTPLSLFTADKLTVLDGHQIEAEGIHMQIYGKNGNVTAPTTIKMRRAVYSQKHADHEHSLLKASEAILIRGPKKDPDSGPSYIASGTGLIYDLDTGRGFLLGPASTLFHIEQSDPAEPTAKAGPAPHTQPSK